MKGVVLGTRAKRRPAGGHAHERQAHDVAARFAHGEKHLARYITPAPAAAFSLPLSPGIPLASGLRSELEKSFGADLGAVRLHHDVHAAAAAHDAGARAFASGAHIYFGDRATDSAAGRVLLAHEVTHVLQQTARTASDGIVSAVDRQGRGEVQKWSSPLESTSSVADIPDLLAAHRDALDASAPERAVIERLLKDYLGAARRNDYTLARGTHVLNDSVDPTFGEKPSALPAPVASALYDLLKGAYLWGPAAKLLDMRRDLRTRFFSAETYEHYMGDHGGDFGKVKARLYAHWYSQPWFGNANPRFMLDLTQTLLLGPTAQNKEASIGDGSALLLAYIKELKRVDSGEMLPDELYFITVMVAGQVDLLRFALLHDTLEQVRRFPGYDAGKKSEIKTTLAQQLRTKVKEARASRAKALQPTEANNRWTFARESLLVWFDDVLPALADMAEFAYRFWQGIAPFEASLREGKPIAGLTEKAVDALKLLDSAVPGFRPLLDTFLHAILDRDAGGMIAEPGAFEKKRDDAIRALDSGMRAKVERPLADKLIDALPSVKERAAFSFDSAMADRRVPAGTRMAIAWALFLANQFRQLASKYSRAADEQMRARQRTADATAPAHDLRHLLRERIAKRMIEVARLAGWTEWTEWARPILEAKELIGGKAMSDDYIALGTDWQLDADAVVSLMAYDLEPMPRGFEPLSRSDLVDFYLAVEYRRMSSHITRLIGERGTRYERKDVPILNEALKAARAEHRPKRWLVRDWAWFHPWTQEKGQLVRAPRGPLRELLRDHPLTKARIADDQRQYSPLAWSVGLTKDDGKDVPVLWVAPSPIALMKRVQVIAEVNQVLLTALKSLLQPGVKAERQKALDALRTHLPTELEQLAADQLQVLPWDLWWALWHAVLAGYEGEERGRLVDLMRTALRKQGLPAELEKERRQALAQYLLDERRGLSHERRRIVEVQLRPALQNFAVSSWEDYQIPGGPRTKRRNLAREAAALHGRLSLLGPDNEGAEAHQAIALFELSDTIEARLGKLDDVNEFYAWAKRIDDALYWAGPKGAGADPAVRDSYAAEGERGDAVLFDARRARLTKVLTRMGTVFREHYKKWGIVARAGDGTIENPGSAHAVGEGQEVLTRGMVFANEGHTYEIIQVHESFTFHPGAVHFRSLPSKDTGGTVLKIEGFQGGRELSEQERPDKLLMHVIIDGEPDAVAIRANDDPALLSQLTWALHMYAIVQSMGRLAAAMETFAELAMDLAELFPVVGQAVAAARLVTTATIFIAGDLPEMAKDLIENPRKWLDEAWARLRDLLTIESLIDYLLFSNHNLNGLISEERRRGTSKRQVGTSRRMKRLLHKLQTLARGVGRVMARMHDGVQDRRQQVEHFVQGSPGIVRGVQLLADYYFIIESLINSAAQMGESEAIEGFKSGAGGFLGNIDDLIASLGHIELPKEILPVEELIHIIIDVIGHRLGGKYKLGVRILLDLLDAVGAKDYIISLIADQLKSAGLTKAVFPAWEEKIIPEIGKHLLSAQQALRNTLDDAFSGVGVDKKLTTPKTDIKLAGNDFPDPAPDLPAGGAEVPEAQPLLEEGVRDALERRSSAAGLDPARAAELLRTLPAEGGEPMPTPMRLRAQARFGRDFSHVRLHRGGRATELSQSLGAKALTSGSHILLGSAAREGDDQLLYHELAHVVQQTGPRTSGSRTTTRPRTGRVGRGLRWDAHAEAKADNAAAAALQGDVRGVDLGAVKESWQPAMIDVYGQRFLRQLTDITAIEAEVAEIDKTGALTGKRLIGRDVRKAVSGVADNLREKFKPGSSALYTDVGGPFHSELEVISKHLLYFHPEIKDAVEDIAIRASYQAEKARGSKPARMALDVDDFKRRLERYIFGKTGILLALHADRMPKARGGQFKNPKAPFTKAEVKFVFLAPMHGNVQLWRDALQYRTYSNSPATKIRVEDQPRWRTLIRSVLRELGPSSSIWQKNEYRLSYKVFAAAEKLEQMVQTGALTGALPPTELPDPGEYRNTTAGPKNDSFGNIRLHLGTYAQKKTGEQRGKDRESHHITQYLLAEYFHNGSSRAAAETDSERMGFPLLRKYAAKDPYGPKMTPRGTRRPETFDGKEIAAIEEGRGGKMPTILLARGTHRHGNLHLSPSADDLDDTATSQAGAMNQLYKKRLPPDQRTLEREVANGGRKYEAWEDYVKRKPNFDEKISNAMQQSYAALREQMQKQLKVALPGIERDYYNDVYFEKNPKSSKPPMTREHMNEVWRKAVKHNRKGDEKRGIKGMDDYGWKG